MAGDHDEVLGKLTEELLAALEAGEAIDATEWAARFGVDEAAVKQCQRGLVALGLSIGEELECGHPELPQPQLPDDFEVVGELGRGGMGVVYRARQRSLDRDVAIKVLRPGDLVFGEALRRFRSEARSLARLRHRHIVSVYDSGETPEGLVWFAMDLVDGRTLADELKSRGRMLPARATKIIRQITSAIAHAHAQGIVHRDLKPHNVLIDGNGDAFVVDFGLARDASAAQTNTMSGELLGTPAYMSPEQARGDTQGIGERTDVWALGTLLYEMLTGKAPYSGMPLHETIRAILNDDAPSLRRVDKRVPQDLDLICSHALQKRPEDRYAGALAFGEDVERFQDGRGVMVEKPSKVRRIGRVLKRRWRLVTTVAAAVLVTLTAVAMWLPTMRREAVVAEAQRLVASGHPAAAIESLEAILADLPPNADGRKALEYDLVQALNDRAGELLLAKDLDAATVVATRAYAIAQRFARASGRVSADDWLRQQQWTWQFARAAAIAVHERSPYVPIELLQADLESELPGRAATARRAATMDHFDLSRLTPAQQTEVLRAGLRYQAQMDGWANLSPNAGALDWLRSVHDCWTPALEDMLADLATSEEEHVTTRALAFHTLCRSVGLPTFTMLRASEEPRKQYATAAEVAAVAPATVAAWRTWRSLPREGALQARIDLLVKELTQPGSTLPGAHLPLGKCREWTGFVARDATHFRQWWLEARKGSYESLLRKALGLGADQEIRITEALDNSTIRGNKHECLWRQLAWLQVPDGIRIPEAHHLATNNSVRWRTECVRASGQQDDRPFTVRIAILRFDDGSGTPELVAQQHKTVHIDQPIQLDLNAKVYEESWLSMRKLWEDEHNRTQSPFPARGLGLQAPTPDMGMATARIRGQVRINPDGAYFEQQHGQFLRVSLPWPGSAGRDYNPREVWPGTANALARSSVTWDMERCSTHFLLLASLEEATTTTTPDLQWWHDAVASSFDYEWLDKTTRIHRGNSADWLTTSLWPTPAALGDMQALLQARESTLGDQRQMALCLAGSDDVQVDWSDARNTYRIEQAVRVATASASARQRANALKVLDSTRRPVWTPRLGQTLTNGVATHSLQVPDNLNAQLDSLATPDGIVDSLGRDEVLGILAFLGICFWAIWTFIRGEGSRTRRIQASLAALAAACLYIRIEIGGVVLTPSFILLAAIIVLLARSGVGRTWWRVTGMGLLSVMCVWTAASWFVGIRPPFALEPAMLVAAFVAVYTPHREIEKQRALAPLRSKVTKQAARDEARSQRLLESKQVRSLGIIMIVLAIGYFGLQVLSGHMSHELLSNAKVQLVDRSGNPIAGVRCMVAWTRPTPFRTGIDLPPSDEYGYVDLSRIVNRTSTLGRFDIWAMLPGYEDESRRIELSTTIELPEVGSVVVRLLDADGKPWRDPSNEEMYAALGNHPRVSFDKDGRATFPIAACGKLTLSGDMQGTDLLAKRQIDGPSRRGETKVIDITVPRNTPRVIGTVHAVDGTPVHGKLHLELQSPSSRLWANVFTDEQGHFRFLMDRIPTDAELTLTLPFDGEHTLKLAPAEGPVVDLGKVSLLER